MKLKFIKIALENCECFTFPEEYIEDISFSGLNENDRCEKFYIKFKKKLH